MYDLRPRPNQTYAFDETVYVQREVDDGLRVFFDHDRQKFVVHDAKAPGGPDASYVMIVQFDGPLTPVDGRTIRTLRKLRHHDVMTEELAMLEAKRQANWARQTDHLADGLADDMKWVGQAVVTSVASRDRAAGRETIRRAALEN